MPPYSHKQFDAAWALTIAFVTTACTVSHGLPVSAVPPSQRYPFGEAAAVYRVVLDTLYGLTERPPAVILWDSTQLTVSHCENRSCTLLPPHRSPVDESTLRAFQQISRHPRIPMRSDFGYRSPIILIGLDQQPEMTKLGEEIQFSVRDRAKPDEMPFWVGFERKYPGAWGRTTLTAVAFNSRHTQALLQVMHTCGGYCGSIEDVLLDKRNGVWAVTERMLFREYSIDRERMVTIHGRDSVDDYRILGSLRYLGPSAFFRREFLAREDSMWRAVADSLALEKAPTRIAGTVVNRMTGKPLEFAVVIAHSAPGDVRTTVVADSAGAFVFRNLRGTTMLEVRCPGSADRPLTTLAAPGMYARAAFDTSVTITVPDLIPCWAGSTGFGSYRIHRLSAGLLESKEVRYASYPAGEAEHVYHVVLDAIIPSSSRNAAVVLSARTATRCVVNDECGGPELARLAAQGTIDSTTIRDFIRVNRDSVPIRPTFRHRRETVLLTTGEKHFLEQQGSWLSQFAGDISASGFWRAFREAFPHSSGIISLSRVGFNSDSTQALVEAQLDSTGGSYRPHQMILLKKTGVGWTIARRHIERERTSGEFRDGRCVPVNAPRQLPSAQRVSELRGDYAITQVVTSRGGAVNRLHLRITPLDVARPRYKYPSNDHQWLRVPEKIEVIDKSGTVNANFFGSMIIGSTGALISLDSPPHGLDGYTNQLFIRALDKNSFSGWWSSGVGVGFEVDPQGGVMPNPAGYFCARPIEQSRPAH